MDLLVRATMTEEWLIKELDAATKQLNIWWNGVAKADSLPRKLQCKIMFLRGYLGAIRNQKDEEVLGKAIADLKEEFWRKRFYGSPLQPKVHG